MLTVFNRKELTLRCLRSIENVVKSGEMPYEIHTYLTDDGSSDGTSEAIRNDHYSYPVSILKGDGSLFWNGGMINSWKAALSDGGYDGYLWLNNDTEIYPEFWNALSEVDDYAVEKYGFSQIYVGSCKDADTGGVTYGGFNFVSKFSLKDEFVEPDGTYHECQAAHGNLTYISHAVVERMGIFTDKYIHGGGDHDYTYRAFKAGFHLIVMPKFMGQCENDHKPTAYVDYSNLTLKERWKALHTPTGYNLHNALLFQRRCFPYRYPFVLFMAAFKLLLPKLYFKIYQGMRR